MEKEKPFKLFVPPRLSSGQVSAVKPQASARATGLCQGFNKCPDDDFNLPFVMSTPNRGEITDSDTISQEVKLGSEIDEENVETVNELYSKLYKEAEKIKLWKLTVESELKQKERKLQENRKIIEAQRKAIQELQFENEKLSLKLEDEISENKDLLKENSASRHLCNLLKETCTHFTEKSTKYEHEREETRQLYEELNNNVERMIVAFEELRVQAENTRLEMCFKLKEEAEKVDKLEKECQLEVSVKEKQIAALTIQSDEKDDVIRDMETQLQESKNKIADLEEAKRHEGEMLKESQISQEHLRAELEEAKVSLQKTEKEIQDLKVQLTSTAEKEQNYLDQLKALNTDLEQEALKNEQLTAYINELSLEKEQIAQEKRAVATELEKLQESHEDSRKKEENTKQLVENLEEANGQLRNELESLKEKMAKKGEEIKSKLDEREENAKNIENEISRKEKQLKILENKLNNLKKQVENKNKCIEELQQENKVLKKKITAESKKTSIYEGKVNKLELEMENMNKQHKETIDIYEKDIETKKVNENKLLEEVERMKLLAHEATAIQRETDIRCQHKITEMVALMEKHKREYDKMVEEKDTELKLYKVKDQEQFSSKRALENELSCLKSELSSLKEQLKAEIEEKESLAKKALQNMVPENEKKHKKIQTHFAEAPKSQYDLDYESISIKNKKSPNDVPTKVNMMEKTKMPPSVSAKSPLGGPSFKGYMIKTPPVQKLQSESTNLLSEESMRKKQKVLLQLDTQSDSSEQSDLLSLVSEEEMFKKLYRDYPQASQLYAMTPKKKPATLNVKTPGSVLKLSTMRKMREAGWTAVSKLDRKRKMKEAEKLFT
ncbi:synaptonemal complex protein 1 isoform X7 [Strigops habroptila]|uniref:synaptonemal complex protein 1 isoform X7 n=1 Tax=Strigops habroptila TaxID=2489341 RepID=UPI0011CF9DC3|nr:synaptonemal complex protein 1 isoform X7 [Strigops habroptila]